jgi:hypothetical protein
MVRFSEAFLVAVILLITLIWVGCDQLQSDTNTKQQQQQPQRREHHFDPIAQSDGSLAVDTTTGQMCKTWQWVCGNGDTSYNEFTKKYQDNMSYGITCSAIRDMPTCESISRQ